MNKLYRCVTALCLLSLLFSVSPSAAQAAPATAVPNGPIVPSFGLVDTPFSHWTVGGFFLYWSLCDATPTLAASASPAVDDGYLRRLATGLGRTTYMNISSFCADHFAADDSGLYAYTSNQDIVKRLIEAPYTSVLVHHTNDAPVIPLVVFGNYIFWASSTHIYRVNKDGSDPVTIATDTHGTPFPNLLVFSNSLVWMAGGSLWRVSVDCGSLPCGDETPIVGAQGSSLVRYGEGVLWRDTTTVPQTIRKLNDVELCYALPATHCATVSIYTSAGSTRVGALAVSGSQLFFVENECADFICAPTTTGRLRRMSLASGLAVTIAQDVPNFGDELHAQGCCIYFELSPPTARQKIVRLPVDTTPLIHNLQADGWEITQGIQRLTNDVPLVAHKPTFVRVYGRQLAGPRANTVEAAVYGYANGAPLAGSPLWPMEGRSRSLVTGGIDNRLANDGWLFQLPDAWTQAGALTLQVRLDPRGVYDDPNPANNGLPNATYPATTFNFLNKSPVCVVSLPVRTHGPVPDSNGASYWDSIGYLRRVWPTAQVWTYHQNNDVAEREFNPWPTFGPYELPDDTEGLLTTLAMRDLFSDDPDECDNSNARTHYIGLVSAATVTTPTAGSARRGNDQAWVKLPPDGTNAYSLVQPLTVLAHELGHDYDRKHVNCGGPDPDSLDNYYPYPVCQLDFAGPASHVGFDSLTLRPVNPALTGDLMSYTNTIWISDYTWRGLLQDMPIPSAAAQTTFASAPTLAATSQAVFVLGTVSPDLNQGSLEPAWVFPVTSLGAGLLSKWQAIAAPSFQAAGNAPLAHAYHVRLLDAGGAVLADQVVTPSSAEDDPGATAGFALTFPAPAGTPVRLELLDGSTVLASLQPGPSAPVVTVTQPAAGQVVQAALTVSFQASDADAADQLYATVQYSPDGGLTWRALVTNLPQPPGVSAMSLPLSLAGLPGATTEALIRVAVSDGLHTTLATSQPFTVGNQPPEPAIFSPALDQAVPAGQPVVLQGAATDPEDGFLPDAHLSWTLDGTPVGTGTNLSVPGLAPGSYAVTLTAIDELGLEQSAQATLVVGPLSIPLGSAPALDGVCDDDAYAAAAQVQLAPFVDGAHGTVHLLRTSTDLWLCFSGLPRGTGDLIARAGVHLDVNNSRDALVQTGDYDFYVGEDGTPASAAGDGLGNFSNAGPAGLQTRTSANDVVWNAELRLPAGVLGGWGHVVGIDLGEYWVGAFADDYHWPHRAGWNQPVTWARAALGTTPWVTNLSPATANAGAPAFALTVTGTGFASGATVRWNGGVRPTTFISSTVLRAQISAADIALAGLRPVTVVNPGLEAAPSNPIWFAAQAVYAEAAGYRLYLPLVTR